MASVVNKRKLKILSIEEKMKILLFLNEHPLKKKGQVAAHFGIPLSTLSTIIKNRECIRSNYESTSTNNKMKKIRKSEYPDIETCLQKWFVVCRDLGVPVSGAMLLEKAEDFAKELGYSNFKASNGWLGNFKKRHDIAFRKIYRESSTVDKLICANWIDNELPVYLKNYKPKDVFNADETSLFYQCLPDKTDEYKDGKQSKVHVTLLLATNQSGDEKLPPLMIGCCKKPRCLENLKSFPMEYKANKKAWMTSDIFGEWLKSVDKIMYNQNRNVLLFIDNCKAHCNLPKLNCIEVKFFPPNTTSKLQPLEQGIIKSLKVSYRKQIIRNTVVAIDENKEIHKISILDAMRFIDLAWRSVSENTIKNCFRKAGFGIQSNDTSQLFHLTDMPREEDTFSALQWDYLKTKMNINCTLEDFIQIDTSQNTCDTLTDAEILVDVTEISDSDDEIVISEQQTVTLKKAQEALDILRTFLETTENVGEDEFKSLATLQKTIQLQWEMKLRQTD